MEEEDNDFFYECDEKTLSEVVSNEEEPPSKGSPSLLSTQRKRRRPEQPTRTPRPSWQRLRAALGGGGRGRECRPEARLFFRDFACDEDFAFMISLLRGRCQGSQDGCSAEAMVASGPVPLVKLSLNGPFVLRARHTRMLADVLCGSAVRELRLSDGQELGRQVTGVVFGAQHSFSCQTSSQTPLTAWRPSYATPLVGGRGRGGARKDVLLSVLFTHAHHYVVMNPLRLPAFRSQLRHRRCRRPASLPPLHMHTHAHMYMHTHAHAHAHAHAHTHAHTHTRTNSQVHTHTHTPTCTLTCTLTHSYTLTHPHTHTRLRR